MPHIEKWNEAMLHQAVKEIVAFNRLEMFVKYDICFIWILMCVY